MRALAISLISPVFHLKGLRKPWLLVSLAVFPFILYAALTRYVEINTKVVPKSFIPKTSGFSLAGTTGEKQVYIRPNDGGAMLTAATWVPQSFNNCGPATVSMVLQYFGYNVNQNETKKYLRTNPDDKNVFSYEIRDYLKTQYNIESKIFYNGNVELLKTLVGNGFYVIVEDWLHPNEDIGHVLIIRGYDDSQGVFIADDSYLGSGYKYKYEEFDQTQWKAFNREYMPVYTADKEELLKAIVGENWDEKVMYEWAVAQNTVDVEQNPNDMYGWFNIGTGYYALNQFDKAKEAFEKSRALGWPRRMLWYQIQPVQTYNALGEYDKALELAANGLWANDSFAELHVESAIAYKGLGNIDKAKVEINKALNYSPNLQKAKELQSSL